MMAQTALVALESIQSSLQPAQWYHGKKYGVMKSAQTIQTQETPSKIVFHSSHLRIFVVVHAISSIRDQTKRTGKGLVGPIRRVCGKIVKGYCDVRRDTAVLWYVDVMRDNDTQYCCYLHDQRALRGMVRVSCFNCCLC